MMNMITSADGHVFGSEHRSGPLAGPADRAMFRALRGEADVVLAGANTVRIEHYGAPRLPAATQAARADTGRPPLPRLAVVSGSLDLDPEARLFREAPPDQTPIVVTTTSSLEKRPGATALEPVATFLEAGETTVDWPTALRRLAVEKGTRVLLVEGGPNVNGQLIAADLVDELCLTLSPMLVGGSSPPTSTGPTTSGPSNLRLTRVLEEDGFLLLRYLRDR